LSLAGKQNAKRLADKMRVLKATDHGFIRLLGSEAYGERS